MAEHPILTATREQVIETFIRGRESEDKFLSGGRGAILALFDALHSAVEERNRLREALRMVEENAVSFARSAAEASDPWMVGQIRQFFLDPARTALKKGEI